MEVSSSGLRTLPYRSRWRNAGPASQLVQRFPVAMYVAPPLARATCCEALTSAAFADELCPHLPDSNIQSGTGVLEAQRPCKIMHVPHCPCLCSQICPRTKVGLAFCAPVLATNTTSLAPCQISLRTSRQVRQPVGKGNPETPDQPVSWSSVFLLRCM